MIEGTQREHDRERDNVNDGSNPGLSRLTVNNEHDPSSNGSYGSMLMKDTSQRRLSGVGFGRRSRHLEVCGIGFLDR